MATERKSKLDKFKKEFSKKLSLSNSPPFIFAGSGLSIRYYGISTWMGLLKDFTLEHSSCFTYEFGYYSSICSGDPLKIASTLAKEFHEHWWKSDQFAPSRKKFEKISGLDIEIAFKIELCSFINERKQLNDELKNEIKLLANSTISGIVTTNWDDFLQNVFTEFSIKVGQKEMIFGEQQKIGDLFKIHGCSSSPETLVVTSKDYEIFMKDNHFLNSKLLTLFVDFPIIFMGYSLSDPNIELIFKNLISCLDSKYFHLEKMQNRLFFVEWQHLDCIPSIESTNFSLNSVNIPIQKIKVHNYSALFEVLNNIPRKISVAVLRQLQNMVYKLVLTKEPTKKIMVNGLDKLDNIENLEVVVGFGNISKLKEKGVIGIKAEDLLEDILFDNLSKENYSEIVEQLLPNMVNKGEFIPFFKYQKVVGNLKNDNSLINFINKNYTLARSQNIGLEDYRAKSSKKTYTKQVKQYSSLQELLENNELIPALVRIPYVKRTLLNVKVLREFLTNNYQNIAPKTTDYSYLRKCICLLDFLENTN